MGKIKKILILFSFVLIVTSLGFYKEDQIKKTETQQKVMNEFLSQDSVSEKHLFGILEIPKINLKQPIYPKDDPENQVDKNVTLLEEDYSKNVSNHVIVLAAHSGNGSQAYFKNLTSLQIGDAMIIWLKKERQEYQLIKKEEVKKNETLYLKTYSFPHLILITCSKTNSKIQEIYYAKYVPKE